MSEPNILFLYPIILEVVGTESVTVVVEEVFRVVGVVVKVEAV